MAVESPAGITSSNTRRIRALLASSVTCLLLSW
jgi:hypothetical protein